MDYAFVKASGLNAAHSAFQISCRQMGKAIGIPRGHQLGINDNQEPELIAFHQSCKRRANKVVDNHSVEI
jgi:hypothetical protein